MSLIGAIDTIERIGDQHDALLAQRIYVKTHIKSFLRCPVAFEQRYFGGRKEKPGYYMQLGIMGDAICNQWGYARLTQKPFTLEEARQLLSDSWDELIIDKQVDLPINKKEKRVLDWDKKDKKLGNIMKAYREWERRADTFGMGTLEAIQASYGMDGTIMMGKVRFAGHPDSVWTRGPGDFKMTKSTSGYRRQNNGLWNNIVELTSSAKLTGKDYACLFPFIHDFRSDRNPRVEQNGAIITKRLMNVGVEIIERVVTNIEAGRATTEDLRGGWVPEIGKYPCNPDWCGFFGTCPVTKGLAKGDL